MKRFIIGTLVILLVLSLVACDKGQSTPTWQEQYDLGIRYLSEGNYEEAIIAFMAAIEIDPKQANAYLGLADAYYIIGNYDRAVEAIISGQAEYGDLADFSEWLDNHNKNSDADELPEYLNISDMFQYDGVISFDDLPGLFSARFNRLGEHLAVENQDSEYGYYSEHERSGYYTGMHTNGEAERIDYTLNVRNCHYYDEDSGTYIISEAPLDDTSILQIQIIADLENYDPTLQIGLKDIKTGDSYLEVIKKLGLDADLTDYMRIGLTLFSDGSSSGFARRDNERARNNVAIAFITIDFKDSEDGFGSKHIGLEFDEDGYLNFVQYEDYDFLLSQIT